MVLLSSACDYILYFALDIQCFPLAPSNFKGQTKQHHMKSTLNEYRIVFEFEFYDMMAIQLF